MNIFCKFGIMVRGDTVNTLKDIRITEIKSVSEIYSEKGRRFCMHNRESFGLSFCRGGQITYTQNGEKYISDKDNAIILPKGKSYSLKGDKTGIFPVVNFDCVGFSTDTFLILPLYNRELVIKDFEHIMELYGIAGKELKCISLLYDISVLHYKYDIRLTDSGKSVCNYEACPSLHHCIKSLLYLYLSSGINR